MHTITAAERVSLHTAGQQPTLINKRRRNLAGLTVNCAAVDIRQSRLLIHIGRKQSRKFETSVKMGDHESSKSRISRLSNIEIHFNPLNAEFNPICHLLALLGAHHILHISRVRVNLPTK